MCRSWLNMRRQGTCVRHAHIANCVTQGRRKLLHTAPWKRTASAIPGLLVPGTFRSLPQVLGGRLMDGRWLFPTGGSTLWLGCGFRLWQSWCGSHRQMPLVMGGWGACSRRPVGGSGVVPRQDVFNRLCLLLDCREVLNSVAEEATL